MCIYIFNFSCKIEFLPPFVQQVAPFNTYYSQLEEHIAQVGVDLTVNKWDEPLVLGMVDPHDSLSHPAGVSDVQAGSATCLDPGQFTIFLVCLNFTRLICVDGVVHFFPIMALFFLEFLDIFPF